MIWYFIFSLVNTLKMCLMVKITILCARSKCLFFGCGVSCFYLYPFDLFSHMQNSTVKFRFLQFLFQCSHFFSSKFLNIQLRIWLRHSFFSLKRRCISFFSFQKNHASKYRFSFVSFQNITRKFFFLRLFSWLHCLGGYLCFVCITATSTTFNLYFDQKF